MKKEFIKTMLFALIFFLVTAGAGMLYFEKKITAAHEDVRNELLQINANEQWAIYAEDARPNKEVIERCRTNLLNETREEQVKMAKQAVVLCLCLAVLCMVFVFTYLYVKIIKPFAKLERYAEQIAGGDFSIPLDCERTNFFGAFTWAFDHMRKEIVTARESEAQAVRENKTIIASLSHDIKTPVASIRAYAEGLEANLDADYESRERYLQVIMRKCDEVSRLVNDLALHSLSELERLEIKAQSVNMQKLLIETVRDMGGTDIVLQEPVPDVFLSIDEKRMAQALWNVLENAVKYAPGSRIEMMARLLDGRYEIHIRDYGSGILPEDMPFVNRKFYRGKNVEDKPGSGLGLYIVDYIMERMHGGMILENRADGLEVILWLPAETER